MNLNSRIGRGNTALPACSAQFCKMALFAASESHVHFPFLGTQPVYVAIKQVVSLWSQTPFKCSVAGPRQSLYLAAWLRKLQPFQNSIAFSATSESEKPLLKELCLCLLMANRTQPRKFCYQAMFNSVLLYLGLLFKLSQVLCGFSQPCWCANL